MVVVVLTAVPVGLRGQLTRWLLEVAPGVFVGRPSARIRDELWDRITDEVGDGRALMAWQTNNEQGLQFRNINHDWVPTDFDGIQLMLRPSKSANTVAPPRKAGWSSASRRRRYGNG